MMRSGSDVDPERSVEHLDRRSDTPPLPPVEEPYDDERISSAFKRAQDAYERFVQDVERHEQELQLPGESDRVDVAQRLRVPLERWQTDLVPNRTVPATVAIAVDAEPIPDDLLGPLVGLDVAITALDDIVDEREYGRGARFDACLLATFGTVLSTTAGTAFGDASVDDLLVKYLLTVAQTPSIERLVAEEFADDPSPTDVCEQAVRVYEYRASDIDAFVQLPSRVLGIDEQVATRLSADLRTFRARQLLYDDLRDVEADVTNGSVTPIVHLLRTAPDTGAVLDGAATIVDSFSYSSSATSRYREALVALERRPVDVEAVVEDGRSIVADAQ